MHAYIHIHVIHTYIHIYMYIRTYMERAKIWFQLCDFVLDYADMQMYGPRFHLILTCSWGGM